MKFYIYLITSVPGDCINYVLIPNTWGKNERSTPCM